MTSLLRKIWLLPVHIYRKLISPLLPPCCRYTPGCSAYFIEAVNKHGIIKGTILGGARICRCNACFRPGTDPVPDTFCFGLIKQQYKDFRNT